MSERSFPELLGGLVEDLTRLFRQEITLARTEVSEKIDQATHAVVGMLAGAILLLAALLVLLQALVAGLVEAGIAVGWASLAVGVVVAIIGFILMRKGMSDISASKLTPRRTIDQLHRDTSVAKEQVR